MQNKTVKALAVIDSIVLVLYIIANMIMLYIGSQKGTFTAYDYVIYVAKILISAFAVYYFMAGAKKGEGSVLFKLFMNFFAVGQLIIFCGGTNGSALVSLLIAIEAGCLAVISTGTDLGAKKSKILAYIVVGCEVVCMVYFLLNIPLSQMLSSFTGVVLSLSGLLMIYAKYIDKKARGSK